MLTSRRILGLALTPRAITAAEVLISRSGQRLMRAAEMPLSDEVESATPVRAGLKDPVQLGGALKALLQAGGFSASHCVIGLDATYLASRQKRLPPGASANLTDILRIAAEQDFASEGQDLMTDFVPDGAGSSSALLVAAPRGVVNAMVSAARAAGLTPEAVSSSALALAALAPPAGGGGVRSVLVLSPDSAELVVQVQGAPRLLRRLSLRAACGAGPEAQKQYLTEVEADLRRGLALSAVQAHAAPAELLVWNAVALPESALRDMGQRLGVPVRLAAMATDLPQLEAGAATLALTAGPGPACSNPAPAAALAVAHAAKALPLDFLHSRLAVRKQSRFGRVAIWSSVAAAVVIGLVVWLIVSWHNDQVEIDQLDRHLAKLAPTLVEANQLITKTRFAQGWYDRRPKFMECLRELAVRFPDTNIWATNLNVREDMHVTLAGKAADDQWFIRLQNNLKADPSLSEVRLISITGRPNTREVSFAINFTYVGAAK